MALLTSNNRLCKTHESIFSVTDDKDTSHSEIGHLHEQDVDDQTLFKCAGVGVTSACIFLSAHNVTDDGILGFLFDNGRANVLTKYRFLSVQDPSISRESLQRLIQVAMFA